MEGLHKDMTGAQRFENADMKSIQTKIFGTGILKEKSADEGYCTKGRKWR